MLQSETPSYLDCLLFCLVAELHYSPLLQPIKILQRDPAETALYCTTVLIRPRLESWALVAAAVSKAELLAYPVERENSLVVVRREPSWADSELPNEGLPDMTQLPRRQHRESQGGGGTGSVWGCAGKFFWERDGVCADVIAGGEKRGARSVVYRKSGAGRGLIIFRGHLVPTVLHHVPLKPLLGFFVHPHRRGPLSATAHGENLKTTSFKTLIFVHIVSITWMHFFLCE